MKQESHDKHRKILIKISSLPKKIVSIHEMENITEFLLHELCSQSCFNLDKAAFIVDNVEFNCLKGVAGYSRENSFKDDNHWGCPDDFSDHMRKHDFNKKVRELEKPCAGGCDINKDAVNEVAKSLDIKNPGYKVFNLKHGNCGLFLYEIPQEDELCCYMDDALYMFGFCPVF